MFADSAMNIEIRPFTVDAYDQVFALWQQCEGVGLSQADSQASIQAYLSRTPGMSFIATAGGTVVGAVLCGHDGRRGYIHHLAVHAQSRRRSVGRRLVERCLSALQRAGIQKCHIFIFNQNQDGIAFWKSVGWMPRSDISMISKNIEPSGWSELEPADSLRDKSNVRGGRLPSLISPLAGTTSRTERLPMIPRSYAQYFGGVIAGVGLGFLICRACQSKGWLDVATNPLFIVGGGLMVALGIALAQLRPKKAPAG